MSLKFKSGAMLASQMLSVELLSDLLSSSSTTDLSAKLVEQLRELTGAKTVILIGMQNLVQKKIKILHACPQRRAEIFKRDEIFLILNSPLLAHRPQNTSELKDNPEIKKILERNYIESIFKIELKIGEELVGMLLLLDIPNVERFDDVRAIIFILVTPISLLIKNIEAKEVIFKQKEDIQKSVEQLEMLVEQRTQEIAEANRRLEDEKEMLAVTLRSLGEAVIVTDLQGKITGMNTQAGKLLQKNPESLDGLPIDRVYFRVTAKNRKPVASPLKIVEKNELTVFEDLLLLTGSGDEIFISENVSPVKTKNGEKIGIVVVFKDERERHSHFETALKADRLEALGVIAGGIAHDFNNLLAGILGFIEMAARESSPVKVRELLGESLKSMGRAQALTKQLLTFARGGEPRKECQNLIPLLEQSLRFALSGSNIAYSIFCPDDLWHCEFDANQIGQVIDNLAINAKQAMGKGGAIKLRLENVEIPNESEKLRPGKYVKLTFADEGPGIPKEIRNKIFDPFFTTKPYGNGLGLATSFSIMQRHGGLIEIDDFDKEGTIFNLFLPATLKKTASPIEKKEIHNNRMNGAVLVLDDEEILLNLIEQMLETVGLKTIRASDGDEAISVYKREKARGTQFVAGIFDLTIPGGTGGIEAMKQLKMLDPQLPVVVMSGYHESPALADPGKFGFVTSITKPFRLNDLLKKLQEINISMKMTA
ncbi:MAG: ATP-binding protein [Candidatus Rifleibacteriota bacterium]